MGKRSSFDRIPRDYYPTPIEAVAPLIPHLPYFFKYAEPCAGDGRLIQHITNLTDCGGQCDYAADIDPKSSNIKTANALDIKPSVGRAVDFCITNPPWNRKILHPLIESWMCVCPTWFLFDADWMHTKQSATLITYCAKIVSVGRVKWIEGSKNTGKDNCAWYLFDANKKPDLPAIFYGRTI